MAIEHTQSKEKYLEVRKQAEKIFNLTKTFPDNLFQPQYSYYLFFENGGETIDIFYESLINFTQQIGDKTLSFLTIKPDQETFFYKHYQKYACTTFSVNETFDSYRNFLNRDLKEGGPDTIILDSYYYVMFSESRSWGLITSIDPEVGVIGFNDLELFTLFRGCFYETGSCYELPEYMDYWGWTLRRVGMALMWGKFVKNYKSK